MTNESFNESLTKFKDLSDQKLIEVQRNSIYALTHEIETVKHQLQASFRNFKVVSQQNEELQNQIQ
jgi:predicted transcriptional regulator